MDISSSDQSQSWSQLEVVTPRLHLSIWDPSIPNDVLSSVVSKLVRHKFFSRPCLLVQPEFPEVKQNVAGARGLSMFWGSGKAPTYPPPPVTHVWGHAWLFTLESVELTGMTGTEGM